MKAVISGASGLIGTALSASLGASGHEVISLVRRDARDPSESSWDPAAHRIDHDVIASADVVVNLAGASIGSKRLTDSYKRVVKASRVDSTQTIANAIAVARPDAVLIQGSAMGYYGDRGTEELPESAPPGDGFLAEVASAWEAAADPAREAGARVASIRTGLVLTGHGGFAARLLPLVRLGLIGGFGDGSSLQSWITLVDEVRAIEHVIASDHAGPVNMVAPQAARNADLVESLCRAYGRSRGLKVPTWALNAFIGEAADDLLASQAGVPSVLCGLDFAWEHSTLTEAAAYVRADASS